MNQNIDDIEKIAILKFRDSVLSLFNNDSSNYGRMTFDKEDKHILWQVDELREMEKEKLLFVHEDTEDQREHWFEFSITENGSKFLIAGGYMGQQERLSQAEKQQVEEKRWRTTKRQANWALYISLLAALTSVIALFFGN